MNRLEQTFSTLKEQQKVALIPFITAGFPDESYTLPLLHKMVDSGVDVIELGIAFSDPMADGQAIQQANEIALSNGMTLKKTLSQVREFRLSNSHTPIVLMGYANPLEAYGREKFVADAYAAGVDALLVVDLPGLMQEQSSFTEICEQHEIKQITLIAPTTSEQRTQKLSEQASGFVYYVALKGITGAADLEMSSVEEKVKSIKSFTDLPVCVGFGISSPEDAKRVAKVADGVVIGSEIIRTIQSSMDDANRETAILRVGEYLSKIATAIK